MVELSGNGERIEVSSQSRSHRQLADSHLQIVSECLPIFAAAGHFHYLKSACYYVQEMSQLEARHPDLFERFQRGHHVIRRSNKFWAGLSADLVIEQCLMRALKASGWLTRGSGMSEEKRAQVNSSHLRIQPRYARIQ